MIFMESPLFTQQIQELLTDDSYAELQDAIEKNPKVGDLITGSNGLRKIRWSTEGRGKRGGIRVIYYWHVPGDQTYMLLAYAKNKQSDLTPAQLKFLKQLVTEEFR